MYEKILQFCQTIELMYDVNWQIEITKDFIYTKFFIGDKNKNFKKITETFESLFSKAFICKYQPKRTTFCITKF